MKKIVLFLQIYVLSFLPVFCQNLIKDCTNPDYARVIFFRTPQFYGDWVNYKLYLNDSVLTEVKGRHFYVADFAPGITKIKANRNDYKWSKNSHGFIELKLKPGYVYFVKCGVKSDPSGSIGLPKLKLLREKEVNKYIKKQFLKNHLKKKLYTEFDQEVKSQ
jgi:hypothetical protein